MYGELIVRNTVLKVDPMEVLQRLKASLTNGKLEQFMISGDNIKVTCPFHADGHERRPSAFISLKEDEKVPFMWFHCFTDGVTCDFARFVGQCFDSGRRFGEDWLLENYSTGEETESLAIKEFKVADTKHVSKILDESILNDFIDYHPYMTQRKLTRDVIKRFEIKYDPKTRCIVFPVRDKFGRLKFLTRRSVDSKKFIIDTGAEKKDIYLLNEVLKDNCSEVFVCESQINSLTLWSWGIPSVCTFGAGCPDDQIAQLNKSGISHFILALDNDEAGHKGMRRLCEKLSKDKFVDVVVFNDKRDVNDLSQEEFRSLNMIDRYDYLSKV